MTTPTTEPTEIRSGETVSWRREDLSTDYPASTWALSYGFKAPGSGFRITAGTDGDYFTVDINAATSSGFAPGAYDWEARVTDGTGVYTVGSGRLEVLPNLFAGDAGTPLDLRSRARRSLDAIEAVLEGRASIDQMSYQIAGRALSRTSIPDLLTLRDRFREDVRREDQAEQIAKGLGSGRGVYVRFRSA